MTSEPTVTAVESGARQISRRVTVAAPAADLFALVADPARHGELDGSGSVGDAVTSAAGPLRLGAKFSVRMHQYGVPYKITSTVTRYEAGRVLEWRHPAGHKWRYELVESAPVAGRPQTVVTETFDYTEAKAPKVLELLGMTKRNATGIEATLAKLRARYA